MEDASPAQWHRSPLVPPPLLPEHPWAALYLPASGVQAQSGLGGQRERARTRAHARGGKLEVKCLKVRSLFSMNLLYLILSTNSNLIASGLKPLQ